MTTSKASIRYARALFEIARERGIDQRVESDLARLAELLASTSELRAYLATPRVGLDAKKKALVQMLGDSEALTVDFVSLMLDKRRGEDLAGVARLFADLRARASGVVRARVETASPMDERLTGDLKAKLEEITAQHVVLENVINEDLIGGMRIYIGSKLIDGSLQRRLAGLRQVLLATRL